MQSNRSEHFWILIVWGILFSAFQGEHMFEKRSQNDNTLICDGMSWDCRDHSEWAFLWNLILYPNYYFQ